MHTRPSREGQVRRMNKESAAQQNAKIHNDTLGYRMTIHQPCLRMFVD